jgi:hypothetical protein
MRQVQRSVQTFVLPARTQTVDHNRNCALIEVHYVVVFVISTPSHCRAVNTARINNISAPLAPFRLVPLSTRGPLHNNRFRADAPRAFERLVGAIGRSEGFVRAGASLDVATIARGRCGGLFRTQPARPIARLVRAISRAE